MSQPSHVARSRKSTSFRTGRVRAYLRQRWLDYHEHVLRSSVATVRRYRQATQHLLDFVRDVRPLRRVSDFRPCHAEEFVRYLRSVQVPTRKPASSRHATTGNSPYSSRFY